MLVTVLLVSMLAGCPDFPEHLLAGDSGAGDGHLPPLDAPSADRSPAADASADSPHVPDARQDAGQDSASTFDAAVGQDASPPDINPWLDVSPWPDVSPCPDIQPWPDTQPAPDVMPWPDTTPGPLHQESFTTGTTMLDDGQGNWTVQGGVLTQTTCNQAPDTVIPGKTWTDIKVSVRIRGEQFCGLGQGGPTLRVQATTGCNNYYYWCVIDFDNNRLYVGYLKGSCTGPSTSKTTPNLQLNTWYDLQFEIKGQTMSCQLSGGNLSSTITATRTDSTNPILSGSAGLVTDGLKASFDDFVVEAN